MRINPMAGRSMNPMQMIQQQLQALKSNPMQFLMQRRMNLPQSVNINDPNAVLNYLVQSKQIDQNQINQAYQMAQNMGYRQN